MNLSGFVSDLTARSSNVCTQGKGFYISYNPNTSCGPETALVYKEKFYILLGDYQKEYKPIIKKGYKVCKSKFLSLIKEGAKKSPWSN